MNRIFLISCSDHYAHRFETYDALLCERGYQTTYLTSNFDHRKKEVFSCAVPGCVQLPVPAYRKNLSFARIRSHRVFAKRVLSYLQHLPEPPAAIVCLLPPNSLAQALARYHRQFPAVPILFDLFDLWPETFPSGRAKQLLKLPFGIWAALRDHNLSAATWITSECDLFRQRLGLSEARAQTVYFSLPAYAGPPVAVQPPKDEVALAYLGSINNLIDIDQIAQLIFALRVKIGVTLHIIGTGERAQEFCQAAKQAGAQVQFHGAVFDETQKHAILSACHFGLNIMKNTVCVGLTMKSVDYLRHGLPIINNIPADTAQLLTRYRFGIQYHTPEQAAAEIYESVQNQTDLYRLGASAAYDAHFSQQAARNACLQALSHLLEQKERLA